MAKTQPDFISLHSFFTFLWCFITSLLFLVYPFHAESVMWCIARVTAETALFSIWAFYFFLCSFNKKSHLAISTMFFVLALFTYESMWNAPLFFIVLAAVAYQQKIIPKKQAVTSCLLMAGIFGLYVFVRIFLLKSIAGDGYPQVATTLKSPTILAGNFLKLVGRNYTLPNYNSTIVVIQFLITSIVLGYCVYRLFKQNKANGWLALFLLAGMVTGILTFVPLGIDTLRNLGDRYLYYSSIFLCAIVALCILQLLKQFVQKIIIALFIILSSIQLFIYQQNFVYASSVTKATVELVNSTKQQQGRAIFLEVPEKKEGALIFRTGLKEAIDWMAPATKFDTVIIGSYVNNTTGKLPFTTANLHLDHLTVGEQKLLTPYLPLQPTDQIFVFRTNELLLVKLPSIIACITD
jgi:hypothetical protein